jgi:hypothetical protein
VLLHDQARARHRADTDTGLSSARVVRCSGREGVLTNGCKAVRFDTFGLLALVAAVAELT